MNARFVNFVRLYSVRAFIEASLFATSAYMAGAWIIHHMVRRYKQSRRD